jgi:DNA-binding MarR family transcriptional regulator
MDFLSSVLNGILGAFVGGMVTWWAASHFYRLAARDLANEAAALRRHTTLILRSLEQAGYVDLTRDQDGQIVGLVIVAAATSRAQASQSANAHVTRRSE